MADAFPRCVAQLVVAHVCESLGFSSVQRSALETLADVLTRYVESVGRAAHAFAEHSGRTEANVADVALALQDVGTSLVDVVKFLEFSEGAAGPASLAVPSFPVRKRSRVATPSFVQCGELPPREDVPDWLPAFPDRHTYMFTPVWPSREEGGPRREKDGKGGEGGGSGDGAGSDLIAVTEEGKQRRKAEQSLVRLHQRMTQLMTAGGAAGSSSSGGRGSWGLISASAERNPPFSRRLSLGEGNVGVRIAGGEEGAAREEEGEEREPAGAGGRAEPVIAPSGVEPGSDVLTAFPGILGRQKGAGQGRNSSSDDEDDDEDELVGDGMGEAGEKTGEGGGGGSGGQRSGGVSWSGWTAIPSSAGGAGTPASDTRSRKINFQFRGPLRELPPLSLGAVSPLRRKALAARCTLAVRAEDAVGLEEDEGFVPEEKLEKKPPPPHKEEEEEEKEASQKRRRRRGERGRDDEQEEKRKKVEQMIEDAEYVAMTGTVRGGGGGDAVGDVGVDGGMD